MCTHILILRNKPPPSSPKSGKHVDPLPPFNLTLLFSNELGYASYQRLLGVSFVDDGAVYSIQDQFSERTLVFLAEDFTELMPLTLSSLYQPLSSVAQVLAFPVYTRCLSPREKQLSRARLALCWEWDHAPIRRRAGRMLCSGSRCRVPCIDWGVAVYRTARQGRMGGLGLCRYPAEEDDHG